MKDNSISIFTDGSSRGNPGPGGWGAIVVFPKGKVEELGGKDAHTTNNKMELTAAINGLEHLSSSENNVQVFTDSSYVINGVTKWIHGWRKNDWMTKDKKEVLNRPLWEKLADAAEGKKIEWTYIGGHRGSPGNERCDEIATEFADGNKPDLYKGTLQKYGIDILNISVDPEKSKKRSKDRARSKAAAYSYISMVDGKIKTHQTWAECEKRVKGKSGAKFKKSISAPEEREIISGWSGK